jgi:hypothetical protein
MKIKNYILFLIITTLVTMFTGCEKVIVNDDSNLDEDPSDYNWDTTTVVKITLKDNSITAEPLAVAINGNKVTILKAGTYSFSGTLSDGQVIINSEEKAYVRLIFNTVNIKSLNSAPLYIKKAYKTILILNEGTQNILTDGKSYTGTTDGEPNAALFCNSYLSISGTGSLAVTGNYNDGISSDDELVINGGDITVISADDGIRGKDFLIIRDGKINVTSKGDGLKSDNETDASLGYITVDKGEIKVVSSGGDAVNAQTSLTIKDGIFDLTSGGGASAVATGTGGGFPGQGGASGYSGTVSVKALKSGTTLTIEKGSFAINSADDAIHSNKTITINNGTFSIATGDDAIHADQSITINGSSMNITRCYEGFESPSITVTKGDISLISSDDSFNATMGAATESNDGSMLTVSGGQIVLNSSGGDCIDSNGNVNMTGGTLIAHGPPSAPEVGIDVNGTFNISGGLLLATGPNSGNMIEAVSTSSTQYCIKATGSALLTSASLFHIEDADGKDIVTYKPVRNVYYLIISSPDLKNGSTYKIYTGGSTTVTSGNGLYLGGIYSGGTLKKSFSITGKLTSVSF